jgi:exosortase
LVLVDKRVMNRFALRSLAAPLLAALIFALLTAPLWRWLWGEWMGNDYYSHGLLIPLISLFLIIQRVRNDPAIPQAMPGNGGLVLVVLALGAMLFFLNQRAFYLAAVAMIALIAGLVWSFAGPGVLRKVAFPVGYLLLMVPLPFVDRITLPLALFTGVCAGDLVRLLGLEVTIIGNAVSLPNAEMVIGAQCSGINSMIALTSLMALAAYLLDGPRWGRLLLVLMGNILRVASLLFVARAYGADAAFTYYHDYSGIFFFLGVFVLMVPLTRLVQARTFRMEVI